MKPICEFKTLAACAVALAIMMASNVGRALAQEGGADSAGEPGDQWITQCTSKQRGGVQDCSMEQRVILRETGRQIARASIRVAGEGDGMGGLLVQLPLGISFRNGIQLEIGSEAPIQLDVQTCDANGCYAGAVLNEELVTSMSAASEMKLRFRDQSQKELAIGFLLGDFSKAYEAIR